MQVQFIEPFVSAAFSVMETLTGDKPARGQLALRATTFTSQQVTIVAGVTGQVEGTALYGMSLVTAQKIAEAMMAMPVTELDEMALSAISELGNMITGNASTLMSENGYACDITPPSVIRGVHVAVSTRVPAIVVPVNTRFGIVEINVALHDSAMQKAA